ncbi:TetR/AcrR family transcriptional regulator [Devosia aquimaris]|uniref:TetR/AcrR family transcriptional regulator n=1 Tax=Devosia aquimaris TaxID=2866214 RepID=UPI001CD0F0C2|nr:TetR/AcrR family transcriptional regulator [Devosia sp. CJK-A8-3]
MAARANKGDVLKIAASQVAYERGLAGLTLANVAEAAGMPLGSLYYYFKSRDDMVGAAVSRVAGQLQARRDEWDGLGDSRLALRAFAGMTLGQADMLTRHGCPVGTLVAQLGKQDQAGAADIGHVFTALSDWASGHFRQLGLDGEAARRAGRKMVRDLEGAAMLAHATGDRTHVTDVVEDILADIDAMAAHGQPA